MEELIKELELLLSDIAFSGLRNIHPITLSKLEQIKEGLQELSMQEGVRHINRLIETIYQYQSGNITLSDLASHFSTLEFYQHTISGNLEQSE